MDGRFNTIAGWALGAGIVLLGATLVTGEIFKSEAPHTPGYPIAGVEEEGEGGAEQGPPLPALLHSGDAAAGEASFRKCIACHGIAQGGGGPSLGPNLWGTMGAPLAQVGGFAYSDALRSKGGTWTWEAMDEWLRSPRNFAPGTKMTFAGLSDPQERANLMLYLNAQGSNLPLPPPPAAETPAEEAAEAAAREGGAELADDQPVLDEDTTPRDARSVGGEAATDVTGRAGQERR